MSSAINLKEIAEKTEGYSGSDLRELCRDAAMYRVRDFVRKEQMRQIAQQLQDGLEEEMYDSQPNTHEILQGNASTEHLFASLLHLPAVRGYNCVGKQITVLFCPIYEWLQQIRALVLRRFCFWSSSQSFLTCTIANELLHNVMQLDGILLTAYSLYKSCNFSSQFSRI